MFRTEFNATFDCDTWDEKDITALEGSTLRISRTRTERTFHGALEGKAVAEYLFAYHPIPGYTPPTTQDNDDSAKDPHKVSGQMCTYNGVMYFKGKAEGYESGGDGELVFTCTGTWGKGGEMKAVGEWIVVQGSGKGSLASVTSGSGGYVSSGKTDQPCWFKLQ